MSSLVWQFVCTNLESQFTEHYFAFLFWKQQKMFYGMWELLCFSPPFKICMALCIITRKMTAPLCLKDSRLYVTVKYWLNSLYINKTNKYILSIELLCWLYLRNKTTYAAWFQNVDTCVLLAFAVQMFTCHCLCLNFLI